MVLNKDFREFIELLNFHSIKYLVVGGYAVTIYGYPRFTNDIDIWFSRDKSNAEKLLKALKDFGFGSLDIKIDDFLQPNKVIQLGYPPNRIDLLTSVSGLEFDECYPKKVSIDVSGLKIDFIDLESLKKNKKATGRHKDLDDLENLE
ncbi:MAG: nucleotidyltransferase family protein [Candidatus Kapabacteria bacterium]|nr:nucleotidyltransferase family protein [Candidatus Kapabacteria bacterium]